MFEILFAVPDGIAVKSIYQASLELYRRMRLGYWRDDEEMDAAARNPAPLDPGTASVAQVTGRVLGTIERAEGRRLRELSEDVAGGYIIQLSDILMERIQRHPDFNPERGDALLEELRKKYGNGYRHSAAA